MIGHIFIYGEIGTQVTIESVRKQLDPKAESYNVHISSVGGDVYDGYTIYNLLKNTGKNIEIQIEGLCASIATLIAAAGSVIRMNKTAQFMIHNPQISNMRGDSRQLRDVAQQLDKIKSVIVDVYQKRTGLETEKLWEMYDRETWLTADEAKNLGFVDDVQESLKAVATVDINKFINMENQQTLLQEIKSGFTRIINLLRPKNQVSETLEDGTVIVVLSEDEDWVGKQVSYEDGTPLPAGDYTLASGKTITVGEDSTITEVTINESEPEETPENMKALETAQNRIKELESALEARNKAAETAEAKAKKFENVLTSELKALQEQMNKIKTTPTNDKAPDLGVKKATNQAGRVEHDPMADFIKQHVINNRKG